MVLPINPFKKLAKGSGVNRIGGKSCELLAKLSEEFAIELIKSALEITKSNKRTTLLTSDIETAYKIMKRDFNANK